MQELNVTLQDASELKTSLKSQDISAQLGFEVKTVLIDGSLKYQVDFNSGTWEKADGRYRMVVPVSTHGLGFFASVRNIERAENGVYSNVWYAYDRWTDGSIVVYADEAFTGRLTLEGGD